jgi:hypothetical protein
VQAPLPPRPSSSGAFAQGAASGVCKWVCVCVCVCQVCVLQVCVCAFSAFCAMWCVLVSLLPCSKGPCAQGCNYPPSVRSCEVLSESVYIELHAHIGNAACVCANVCVASADVGVLEYREWPDWFIICKVQCVGRRWGVLSQVKSHITHTLWTYLWPPLSVTQQLWPHYKWFRN